MAREKNHYCIALTPRNGMFVKRGKITDGNGRVYLTSPIMSVFTSQEKARKEMKNSIARYAKEIGQPFDGMVFKVVIV